MIPMTIDRDTFGRLWLVEAHFCNLRCAVCPPRTLRTAGWYCRLSDNSGSRVREGEGSTPSEAIRAAILAWRA